MSYRTAPAERLSRMMDLRGARVLEVGGGANLVAARAFLERGASFVKVTNIGHGIETVRPEPGVEALYADATRLSEAVEGPFDVVFGVAVIEHIPDTARWLAETDRVLAPGGMVHYAGGPIWTCAAGHHVWVDGATQRYRFSDASNPIAPWSHLLDERPAFRDRLARKGVPEADVAAIDAFVFESREINRVGHGALRRAFASSPLSLLDVIENRRAIDPDMRERLAARAGAEHDYGVSGIDFILRKA